MPLNIGTDELKRTFKKMQSIVRELGHEYITPEHLLYAALDNESVQEVINATGADIDEMKLKLENYFKTYLEQTYPSQVTITVALERVLKNALSHLFASEQDETNMGVLDTIIAIYDEKDSYARYLLISNNISKLQMLKMMTEIKRKKKAEEVLNQQQEAEKTPALDAYTLNLNELAKDGKIDNIIGREYELERMMQTLCRRKKNNPILIGESGVGKTAITEGLALKIVNDDVPNKIKGSTIYSLDVGSLLAGTKFRGDLEDRLKQIVAELQKKDKAILLIDELHTVMGSGNGPESSVDAASLLKPALANGTIKCIASTTYDEFRKKILNNKAFARRFQKIDVKEPNSDDTFTILNGLKEKYEQFHNVQFTDKALKRSIDLTQKYISDRYLPDKAIDILDEIGAKNSLSNGKKKTISDADIEDIISEILQIPVKQISKKDTKQVLKLEQKLKKVIFGQETPISQVVKAIKLSKAGLSAENKPIGSFLFCGMTGTGKTELAKQIAKHLNIDFIRFDMSEYSEQHSVAKLIGAPPGYVGFDQSGMLTEEIIKKPHSLLLLDEIEKAHSSVYNTLLQIFDYGILTDNTGRKADFKNIIIIMTSNIGAREMSANSIGFVDNDTINNDTKNAVEKFFSPEFRNRLSGITYFNPLNIEIMKLIVKKEIAILQSSLDKKGATIKFSPSAIKWFAENGYDKKLGARPLQRLISKEIQEKIVDMILMEDISENSKIKVGCKSDKITIDILN